MKIDPELEVLDHLVLPDFTSVQVLRQWLADMVAAAPPRPERPDSIVCEDRTIPGPDGASPIPVRIYRPRNGGLAPAVVYFHGGSLVMGDLDTDDAFCVYYAANAEVAVVSVDYRLAPESCFPAAIEDGYAVLDWLARNGADAGIDGVRLAVAGSSSGGTLAGALALLARDRGGPDLALQMMIYPALDDRLEAPSMFAFDTGETLTRARVGQMWRHYLGGDGRADSPYAAPARAADVGGLPRAYIEVGALDPLRDEAIAYASRLLQADVDVDLQVIAGAPHAFDTIAQAGVTQRALTQRAAVLKAALIG
jgi:acetyl esterase